GSALKWKTCPGPVPPRAATDQLTGRCGRSATRARGRSVLGDDHEASGLELGNHVLLVLRAPGFQRYLHVDLPQGQRAGHPGVLDVEHVHLELADRKSTRLN